MRQPPGWERENVAGWREWGGRHFTQRAVSCPGESWTPCSWPLLVSPTLSSRRWAGSGVSSCWWKGAGWMDFCRDKAGPVGLWGTRQKSWEHRELEKRGARREKKSTDANSLSPWLRILSEGNTELCSVSSSWNLELLFPSNRRLIFHGRICSIISFLLFFQLESIDLTKCLAIKWFL